jgi:acetylornithine deacetylase
MPTAHLTDSEARVLDAVDEAARAGRLVADLADLVEIPSVTGTSAEADAQRWVGDRLTALGADVDAWSMDVAELSAQAGFPGSEAPRDEARGLVGTLPGRSGAVGATGDPDAPTLVLQGHVDVVPAGDHRAWGDAEPFVARLVDTPEGPSLMGRGTCDMKAGVVAALAALGALRTAGVRLRGGVAVHSVVSEEDGGLGAFGTLARGHAGDACVIPEPTGRRVITATAGSLTFRLDVPGKAAHGSSRYAGVSAVEAFAGVHRALLDLERRRGRDADPLMAGYEIAYPLSIGVVRAGDWASTVPDALVAEGRYGVRLDESPDDARAAFEACVADACAGDPWLRDHPVRVTWWGGQFASGRLPAGHLLLDLTRRAWADATGEPEPAPCGGPYGSDLRLYAAAGVPTLHLGPGDVRLAHAAREYVPVSDLHAVARSLALLVMRYCGTERGRP